MPYDENTQQPSATLSTSSTLQPSPRARVGLVIEARETAAAITAIADAEAAGVDYHGNYFNVNTSTPRTPRVPILISALREGAFRLAGEISDGAISWLCPVPYLLNKALPALHEGAEASKRPAPPLVAHILVA